MDAVIAREFENELPVVVTKTLISAAAKAAIAYGLQEATRNQNEWVAIGTRIAAAVYQYATNEADVRTWASLPKQFQYARMPTPANRRINVSVAGGATFAVDLVPGTVNVVLVKSIGRGSPVTFTQFALRD